MEWFAENWQIVAAVIAGVSAVLAHLGKAKAAALLGAVVQGVEASGSKQVKQAIQANASTLGVETALHAFVKKMTGAAILIVALVLPALVLSGCASTMEKLSRGTSKVLNWAADGVEAGGAIWNILEGPLEDSARIIDDTFGNTAPAGAAPVEPPAVPTPPVPGPGTSLPSPSPGVTLILERAT